MVKNNIDVFFTFLQSQQTAQQYLLKCYRQIEDVDADILSYENCDAFFYYLKHGQTFYEQGKMAPIASKPILYFYGLTHLLKAVLLTKRPYYPETTKILAHGVSSRKRKKKDYTFIDDTIKIKHHGLFNYVSEHVFYNDSHTFEKITMHDLLAMIPEMHEFFLLRDQSMLIHVGMIDDKFVSFPETVLDHYHLTKRRFLQRITPYMPDVDSTEMNHRQLHIKLSEPIHYSNLIFTFDFKREKVYFPSKRHLFIPKSEIMTHYLLLYNLSMLSRYETEWWGNLLQTMDTDDYPFIKHFLDITSDKTQHVIGKMLYDNYLM